MSAFNNIVDSAFIYGTCIESRKFGRDKQLTTLTLELSNWAGNINRDALLNEVSAYPEVALHMNAVPPLSSDFCSWLAKFVGPKIVEINIQNCDLMSWKTLKKIIACSSMIHTVKFSRCSWVNDKMIEQLTFKCSKTVLCLEFEYVKITDIAIFQVSRQCPNLKRMAIICCRGVTDSGLVELSKRVHLSSLCVRHNMAVTDYGVEALLRKSSSLESVNLCNCPKVTTDALASIYESKVAWGRQRNTRALTLRELVLRGNPNIGPELLAMVSLSSPTLETLDLRECEELDLIEGLKHTEGMNDLRDLRIGPTAYPFPPSEFVDVLCHHLESMRCLHLCGLDNLLDSHIAEAISCCLDLEELVLSNMQFGTLAVEAICSNVPNIKRLSLIGSSTLNDRDLRCIPVICRNLEEFVVNDCQNISDLGYARCAHLRLSKLDLSRSPKELDGSLLACFSCSPLTSLVLDDTSIALHTPKLGNVVFRMAAAAKTSCLYLSLQNNPVLLPDGVYVLLDHFVFCRVMNFTGCSQLMPSIKDMWHPHPSLSFVQDKSFLGYKAKEADRAAVERFRDIFTQTRKESAARAVQTAYKQYLGRCADKAKEEEEMREQQKHYWAIKIESIMRMKLSRTKVMKKLVAGRRIVAAGQVYSNNRMLKKMTIAKNYNIGRTRVRSFKALVMFAKMSKESLQIRIDKVLVRYHKRIVRRYFEDLCHKKVLQKEMKYCECAAAVWEENILTRMMRAWKSLRGDTYNTNRKLVTMFMQCVAIESHNSIRQSVQRGMVEHFRWTKLVIPGWIAFCDDYVRAMKAEALTPMAKDFFHSTFMSRVCSKVFNSLVWYRDERHLKYRLKKRGDQGLMKWRKVIGCRRLEKHRTNRLQDKTNLISLLEFLKVRPYRTGLQNFRRNIFLEKLYKVIYKKARFFHLQMCMVRLKKGCVGRKNWNMMNALATYTCEKKYKTFVMHGWRRVTVHSRNLEEFMWGKYTMRLKSRGFRGLLQHLEEATEFKKQLANDLDALAGADEEIPELEVQDEGGSEVIDPELAAKAAAEAAERVAAAEARKKERLETLFRRITLFQAVARGFTQRMKFRKFKIAAIWASQVLQNFARRALALKRLKLKIKRYVAAERKKQEDELNLMREAEAETRYVMYHDTNAVAIQRCFRGWKGREIANAVAVVIARDRGKKFFNEMLDIRKAYEREIRAAAQKELMRNRAATTIQALVRGVQARKRVAVLKVMRERDRHVITIQRYYRGRLARLLLDAVRRDRVHMDRYKAARRQRGIVLRLFGYKKRTAQLELSKYLDTIGLEPTTFNYRLKELLYETYNDFKDFLEILKRERNIYRETKGNKVLVINARRKYFNLKGIALRRDDAVLVIQPMHKFYGYTGVIVRVDISVPGQPLYEVKLDNMPRQTFVHMTTDGLTYYMDKPQPLHRIEKRPDTTKYLKNRRKELFTGSEEPEFSIERISAAWKIQLAYRRYAARRRVSKRRFEMWMRRADAQRSLISLMQSTNTLTTQTYFATGKLRLRPLNNILFDELRYTVQSARLLALKYKGKVGPAIRFEGAEKYKQRIKFLEKAAIDPRKKPFIVGWQKITKARKMMMFFKVMCGYSYRSMLRLKDMCGSRGIREFSKKSGVVTGLSTYKFNSFYGSPHVRFPNVQMYQGEWKGLPSITPLYPHGEGIVLFFDGWGFSREDKVLHLTILCARHLNAADISTSDPFCEITCNGKNLSTTVIWGNLNPVWNEKFEIDVTNPNAGLNIVVKDKDYIGEDDFLGQILISLQEVADGQWHKKTYQLRGEDINAEEGFDRGEIELQMRWTDRTYDDDIAGIQARKEAAVKLQAWARRLAALTLATKKAEERAVKMKYIKSVAVKITSACRRRLARKEFKRRLRRFRAALKIQKRVRIRIARNIFKIRVRERDAAVRIQAIARMYNAEKLLKRLRIERRKLLNKSAVTIQRIGRKMIAKIYVDQLKVEKRAALIASIRADRRKNNEIDNVGSQSMDGGDGDDGSTASGISSVSKSLSRRLSFDLPEPEPVSSWIDTYGIDSEYYLRRNRRITERGFRKLLTIRYMRLVTVKYGLVFVLAYPPAMTAEEEMSKSSLRERDDFVNVIFPSSVPKYLSREEVIDMYASVPREGYIHIDTGIDMRASVNLAVIAIQCFARQYIARNERNFLIRITEAIAKFQRIFRRRNQKQHQAAYVIQALFYYNMARLRVNHMRLERKSIVMIQCAFRQWRARMAELDIRTIRNVRVLKHSPSLPLHSPQLCLDRQSHTMWVVDSTTKAEIRVELPIKEAIDAVWVMLSTYEASPKFISIGVVLDKKSKEYVMLYSKIPLPRKKGFHWIKFPFKSKISKYFKVCFEENYGDENNISVRQIRFVRAREQSATILKQPDSIVLPVGPKIGETKMVELKVEAEGWPLPKFQWYKNGQALKGETSNVINIPLLCPLSNSTRSYRCTVCKNICRNSPKNAYQVKCMNCGNNFDYKEISKYCEELGMLKDTEAKQAKELAKHRETMAQMRSSTDEALLAMLPGMEEQVANAEGVLKELRMARYEVKLGMQYVNMFDGEGLYVCAVTNKRGKSVNIKRVTNPTVVVIEFPDRYPLKTLPAYNPRTQTRRRRWTIYGSIKGTFISGRCDGIVTIRYVGGSYYEGPYIEESAVDMMGRVHPNVRSSTHWGIFTCADGRVFEGVNVDNHFDPENIQGCFKLTLPLTRETYEGNFVDEKFHGVGVFHYSDGSVYEGEWHVGKRYGHGMLKSSEGWIYEGNFDDDKRHGDGIMWWPNGSAYIGRFAHNHQEGQGLYISKMRDVYRGNFSADYFDGKGELIYNNGSKYTGEFKMGKRHGTGIFIDRLGTEYFGQFVDDLMHGDHVVKKVVQVDDVTETSYEVCLGQYNMGNFVQWIGQSINPASTKQFIRLFEQDRKAFDGVYAMLLTRYLPDAPRGIDTKHPEVQKILLKLRTEGGVLTGNDKMREARETLDIVMPRIREKKSQIEIFKKDIDSVMKQSRKIEAEKVALMKKFRQSMDVVEEESQITEQFWIDDQLERRERFRAACEALKEVDKDEWFKLKNYRSPPPFLKKIMDAVSFLLDLPTEWKVQQMLISDYIFNSLNGDDEALRHTYDCKLVHMMESYDVYAHAHESEEKDQNLPRILADPRFRRDSYYVESLGVAAPYLIDFVKTNYPYMMAARDMLPQRTSTEAKRYAAYRLRTMHNKLHHEQNALGGKLDIYKRGLTTKQSELQVLQKKMADAYDLLKFVSDSYELGKREVRDMDYYELLERKIENERDRLSVEAAMERLLGGVEDLIAKEKLNLKLSLLAKGEDVPEEEPEEMPKPQIRDWIEEEVYLQQQGYIENDVGLGYSIDPGEKELTITELKKVMDSCVENIVLRLNDLYHETLETTQWTMMDGKRITRKFLYVLVWKRWKDEANRMETEKACGQWEEIWGPPEECAKMAIQSKVNWRMSELARKQGAIWAKEHVDDILEAEALMSTQFGEQYADEPDIASIALELVDDEAGDSDFASRAAAICWARLHPSEMQSAQDQKDMGKANEFQNSFPEETALNAFKILNGMCTAAELEWEEYAKHWRNFFSEEYSKTQMNQTSQMAQKFKEDNVFGTHVCAAKVIENEAISQLVENEELASELYPGLENFYNARCWALRNQGMYRAGLKKVKEESASKATRFWNEFTDLTVEYTKGSHFHLSDEAKANPALDRFVGFRNRLEKRFAWVLGYFYHRQIQLTKELEALATRDPSEKIHHNIRPSELKQYEKRLEISWLREKAEAENELEDVMKKIAIWKTYFGSKEVEGEEY